MLDNEKLTTEEMSDIRKTALSLAKGTKNLPEEQKTFLTGILKGLSIIYKPTKK